MNVHQITVTKFNQNEEGIRIDYEYAGKQYHYLATIEEIDEVLASIGNEPTEKISQYDAIMIAAEHERQKKIKCVRVNTTS